MQMEEGGTNSRKYLAMVYWFSIFKQIYLLASVKCLAMNLNFFLTASKSSLGRRPELE